MKINFIKMHGCGNDFLVIDLRDGISQDIFTSSRIIELADYKKSIGFDQLLLIEDSKAADIAVKIFNNDGTEVEACGNGSRCVASLFLKDKSSLTIATKNRILTAKLHNDLVAINMGEAKIVKELYQFDQLHGHFVDVGNPHIIIDVTNFTLEEIDHLFNTYGPLIENDSRFPNKVNVNFVRIIDRNNIYLRTWERGAGATLACGTGACASFALLNSKNIINNIATVKQAGGDLVIAIENDQIMMAGETKISYQGTIEIK